MAKFKAGDRIRVIDNDKTGEILEVDYDWITHQDEYTVIWDAFMHTGSCIYPSRAADVAWELETPRSGVTRLSAGSNSIMNQGCQHEWVDIGFNFSKIICKKCDIAKPKESDDE